MALKTVLEANLTDPREQYTNSDRAWIHTDEPLANSTYPRIQIRKRGSKATEIISMGMTDFWEWNSIIVDIQFWSAMPFKWDSGSNVYLQDEELVKEYLSKIWTTLKAQHTTLKTTYGITGLKNMGEGPVNPEPDNQLYTGIVSVRIWYFEQ